MKQIVSKLKNVDRQTFLLGVYLTRVAQRRHEIIPYTQNIYSLVERQHKIF
jgi:hypothetical protein